MLYIYLFLKRNINVFDQKDWWSELLLLFLDSLLSDFTTIFYLLAYSFVKISTMMTLISQNINNDDLVLCVFLLFPQKGYYSFMKSNKVTQVGSDVMNSQNDCETTCFVTPRNSEHQCSNRNIIFSNW